MAWQTARMCGPAVVARASSATVLDGVRAGRSSSWMRCQPRGAPQMFAQELARLGRDQSDVQIVPLHVHPLPDPAGRRAVVRGLHFDAAIEVDRAVAVPVVAKRFERQETSAGCSSAYIAATWRFVVPWIRVSAQRVSQRSKIGLRLVEGLEADALERRLLAWPTPASTFPLRSGSRTRHGTATTP
jgi:hypothetical protein